MLPGTAVSRTSSSSGHPSCGHSERPFIRFKAVSVGFSSPDHGVFLVGLARDHSQSNWEQVGPVRKVPFNSGTFAIKAEDGCEFQNKAESWLPKLGRNRVVRGLGSEAQWQELETFPTQRKAEWGPWLGAQL